MTKQRNLFFIILSVLCLAALLALPTAAEETATLVNPVTYTGVSTRLRTDMPGLRSLYKVDLDMVAAWEAAGYTVEYGAVMAAATVDGVTRLPENLTVEKTDSGYKPTVSNATAVCIYSTDADASYATRLFTAYDEEERTASFAYTGVFHPSADKKEIYEIGFTYSAFFVATKGDEVKTYYATPDTATHRFFEDYEVSLYELAEYWSTRLPAAVDNPNIVKVLRSRLTTEVAADISASETLTATKASPAVLTLENMKAGIYALDVAGTATAQSYVVVDTNGDVARQRLAAGDFDQTFVHLYLSDGDNTVKFIPEGGTFTLTSMKVRLVEELLPDDTHVYSLNLDAADGEINDATGAIVGIGAHPVTGEKMYYYDGDSGTKTMQVSFKDISADLYRVGIIYSANYGSNATTTVKCGTSADSYELSLDVPQSENLNGSTGGGASFAWLGSLTLGEGDQTVYIATPSFYVNIMDVILVRDTHEVNFYDVKGKLVSVQRVRDGESAVFPSFDTPDGYVAPAQQTLDLDNITKDTDFTIHTWRESITASASDGSITATDVEATNGTLTVTGGAKATVKLSGATAGYYEVSFDTAVSTAVSYLNVKNASQEALYRTRLAAGDKDAVCTVWLDDGTNTLSLYTSGESITYSKLIFRNVSDAYKATRIAATSHDENRGTWTSSGMAQGTQNENLMFRTGHMAAFTDITVPQSGEYYLVASGNTTNVPVDIVFSVADASGDGALVPTETLLECTVPAASHNTSTSNVTLKIPTDTFYLEAGEYAFTLSAAGYFYLDALVLIPHEYHTFDATETVEATCVTAGYTRTVCSLCGEWDGEPYEETDVGGHAYAYVETTAATCTAAGLREEICTVCGDATGESETLSALGHSYEYVETVAPTCTDEGLLAETCVRCGEESGETAIAPVVDHFYEEVTFAPTCTSLGYVKNICSVCSAEGETLSETPMLAHTYQYYLTAEATCTADGEETELCSVCHTPSGNKTVLPATGVHVGEWVILTEPTSSKQGYAAEKCIYCNGTLSNMKLARAIDTSNVSALTAENLAVAEDGKSATFTLTAEVAGFYEVRIAGHSSTGKYFDLYNTTFDETLHSSQKDKDGSVGCDTRGFAVYLKEGENELLYKVRTATAVTLSGATAHLLSEEGVTAYVETEKSYIPEYKTGEHVFGSFEIKTGGFYRVSAFLSNYASTLSFTLTDSTGKETEVGADISSLMLPPLGSTSTAGFDGFGVVYLEPETYELTLNVTTSNKLQIGSVFFSYIPEAEGAYYLYVDPAATPDVGEGTEASPYVVNTLEEAYTRAVSLINNEKLSDIIIGLSGGLHSVGTGLVMDGAEIAATDYSITVNGAASDKSMLEVYGGGTDLPSLITSGVNISGADFVLVDGTGYCSYTLPESAKVEDENGNLVYPAFRDLYVDGMLQTMAGSRPVDLAPAGVDDYKMYKDTARSAVAAGLAEDARLLYLHPSMLGDVALDADGNVIGDLECWIHTEWQTQMVHIEHIDKNPAVSFTATAEYSPLGTEETLWACRVPEKEWEVFLTAYYGSLHKCVYYVKNNIEYLDEAGEFYYDRDSGTVYLYPDGSIESMTVSYPLAERLIYLKNMRNLIFDNVGFSVTTVNFVTENAYFSGQGGRLKNLDESGNMINAFMPYGAIYGENVDNVAFYHCDFSELGGDAINFRGAVDEVTVSDSRFVNVGGSAIRSGHGRQSLLNSTSQHNKDISITQNYIRNTGVIYTLCTAIQITSVENLDISYNTILDSAYSAMSIGWTWSSFEVSGVDAVNVKNASISHNYIENFMTQMQDGGAIYVLGGNASYEEEGYLNSMNNNLVVATPETGNGVNRFTVFYHDSGASHWHDYDNVLVMDPDIMKLRYGVVSYQSNAPAYSNLTERLYFIGYQDDRRYNASGEYLDTNYVYQLDENGNASAVSGEVSAGYVFITANGAYLTNNAELLSQYKAYINPDGSYSLSSFGCLDDVEDYATTDESGNTVYDFKGCDCPLVAGQLTHDHHNELRNCYKYTDFAAAQSSAQYDTIAAICAAAGCDDAKADMDALAALFDGMATHCPYCWGTNVSYVSGKGYRCYTCQPKGNVIQEWFGSFWYFQEFN